MTISERTAGTLSSRSAGATGFRAIWQWTHSIGSVALNGRAAGEHLIERDAERIEVAAGIDRAVHPPGLFGRHVGQRAGDDLGRLGRLTLARQTRGDAEPGEPRPSVRAVHKDIGRLDVLVDEAALVRLAQRGGDADGEAQEASHLHRFADESLERLAARILEQQRCSTAFAGKRERPRRPCGVEFVPQFIFVSEAIERGRRRALRGGQHRQHRAAAARAVRAPSAAEDAFAVLPQDLEISNPISFELKGWVQLPDLALRRSEPAFVAL